MHKFLAGIAAMSVVAAFSTIADASCSCQCVDGQFAPSCTSAFDIPPMCALRTCPFSLAPKPLPYIERGSCVQEKDCDAYGHCEWKQVCK
jgi:hypothetical protein